MNWQFIVNGVVGLLFGVVLSVIVARKKAKANFGTTKKKMDTSKALAYWAAAMATISLFAPYALSFVDKQPVSDMTGYVFPACIGYLITYAGKSLGEKISRNNHHLDENGHPYDTGGQE